MGGPAGGTNLDTAQKKKLLWGAKKVGGSPLLISISRALDPLDICVAAVGLQAADSCRQAVVKLLECRRAYSNRCCELTPEIRTHDPECCAL